MANSTTKKNQSKNGSDVQDSSPPYCHTIANVQMYRTPATTRTTSSHDQKFQISILQNTEPPKLILPFSNSNME